MKVQVLNKKKYEFEFGGLKIRYNTFLSPMAGVTSSAFRRLCLELSGHRMGFLGSDFVAVEAVTRFTPRSMEQLRFFPEERPFCVQIYGADPETMLKGAQMAQDSGADFVEINAGCPAPKVVRRGGGSGLLKDLPLLGNIVEILKKNLDIPVSLKVRTGWDEESIQLFETLHVAESAGIDLFVIHGRTRAQGYKGRADWNLIAEAVSKAHVPIIGNGDIRTAEDAMYRLNQTGVAGVSVGRGALHNPWIFGQVADLQEGKTIVRPQPSDLPKIFKRYRELLKEEEMPDSRILGKLKQFTARILKAFPGASKGRQKLLRSETENQFYDILDEICVDTLQFMPENLEDLNGRNENEIQCGNQYRH